MTYRDDTEGLHARIEALEGELEEARAQIAALKGEGPLFGAPLAGATSAKPSFVLGVPTQLVAERDVPGEADDRALGAIADLVRSRLGRNGQVAQIGRTLTYRFGVVDFSLAPNAAGQSHLRLSVDYRQHRSLVFSLAFASAFLSLPIVGSTLGPAALLVGFPLTFVLGFFVVRHFMARWLAKYQAQARGTVEAVAGLLAEHASPKVRFAPDPSAEPAAQPREAESDAVQLDRSRQLTRDA